MSVVTAQIAIPAPPSEVWAVAMDPWRTPEWVTIVVEVEDADEGPMRPGFQMRQRFCIRGVRFHVDWTLEDCVEPAFARWRGKGPARSVAVIEDELIETAEGTDFHYRNEFKAPLGPLGSMASRVLVGGISQSEANASLVQLKEMLDQPHPAVGDGRRG